MALESARLLDNASATGSYVQFQGGHRAVLVIEGTFATTTKLQYLGPSGAAIDVATLTAAGITSYDLPPGQYRILLSGGSPSGVYADLISVSYM